jgi:hypothetical protein
MARYHIHKGENETNSKKAIDWVHLIIGLMLIQLAIITNSLLFTKVLAQDDLNGGKTSCTSQGYIAVLKDNTTTTNPKAVSLEYQRKGAVITHVYESAFRGFALKIPENLCHSILNGLSNDSRIAHFESDNTMHIQK